MATGAEIGFKVKVTWCGMFLLQDRGVLNGYRPEVPADKGNLADITKVAMLSGITSREQAEVWVAEVAKSHGFNGVNAAFTLTVE